jgi:hypothetical protein
MSAPQNEHRRGVRKSLRGYPWLVTLTTTADPRPTTPVTSDCAADRSHPGSIADAERLSCSSPVCARADALTMPSRNDPTGRTDAQMNDRFTIASRRHRNAPELGRPLLNPAALIFDAYGTLSDVMSIADACAVLTPRGPVASKADRVQLPRGHMGPAHVSTSGR